MIHRALILFFFCAVAGCGKDDAEGAAPADAPAGGPADPIAAARAWLTHDIFAEQTTMQFAAGLDRGDFPARLMVDRPQEYRFVDLWRVRTVDQRLLIDALVQIGNEPQVVSFWMEQIDGAWRIAGWRPQASVAKGEAAPPGGVDLPSILAASAFRGAPAARFVPVVIDEAVSADAGKSRMRVGFKGFTYDGDCPKARVASQVRRQRRRLARCHTDALGEERRPGRLTFAVEITPNTVDASIVEATLVAGALTDCVEAALERIKVRKVNDCKVTVPVTFSPRR